MSVCVCVCFYTVGVSVEKRDVRERVFTFCPPLLPYGTELLPYDETGAYDGVYFTGGDDINNLG